MGKTLGAVLIVIGLIIGIWGAFGFKTKEKVLDIGPVQATKTETHNTPYAPIFGGIILLGGVVLMVSGRRP